MAISVRYQFIQLLPSSAKRAFDWCTAYDEGDHILMGDLDAKREVTKTAEGTILLTDIFFTPAGATEKQKLVQLYPEKNLWTSTHLTGPNKHSQFLYELKPQDDDVSMLYFSAIHLEYTREANAEELASRLCAEDAGAWQLLAKAMAQELDKKPL